MAPRTLLIGIAGVVLCGTGAFTGFAVRAARPDVMGYAASVLTVRPDMRAEARATSTPSGSDALALASPPLTPPPTPSALTPTCPSFSPVDAAWLASGPPPPEVAETPQSPKSLERRVAFWTRVWGQLGDNQHLLVDSRRPWVIHAQVDCRDLKGSPERVKAACGERITKARRDAQSRWKKDWRKPRSLRRFGGDKALARTAHQHVIGIQGRRDALARAKARAAPHLGHAEGLFAAEEVPRIYARAAIVESLWRPEALSRSGAAGAYQFMRKTGAQFLRVDDGVVDERLDPLRASWAAATYMKKMHKDLKKWPLVLTAYNTGPARMKRVMKARKTEDIGRIADAGDFGEFGFDGQNYYAQIVAIGRLTAADRFEPQPLTGRALRVEEPALLGALARCLDVPAEILASANPALSAAVVAGEKAIPKGYIAYVPDARVTTAAR